MGQGGIRMTGYPISLYLRRLFISLVYITSLGLWAIVDIMYYEINRDTLREALLYYLAGKRFICKLLGRRLQTFVMGFLVLFQVFL
jgi:hypothetical protein